jgi:hypothetical protein
MAGGPAGRRCASGRVRRRVGGTGVRRSWPRGSQRNSVPWNCPLTQESSPCMASGSNESESLVALQDETRQLHCAIGQLRQDGAVQLRHPGFEIRFRTDYAAGWRDRLNARLQRARRQVEGAAETAAQGVPLLCERWRGSARCRMPIHLQQPIVGPKQTMEVLIKANVDRGRCRKRPFGRSTATTLGTP